MTRLRELRAPLGYRDFRLLWQAQLLSELGDWAARLALSVLVFQRTGSAALTGLVVTMSVLPWLGIGQVLATLGDRLPRRRVMVASDVIRAAVFVVMALPVPVWSVLVLSLVAALATPPFEAARSALLPRLVPDEKYPDGIALAVLTMQTALLTGYLAGGGLVAVLGPSGALVVNAASFAASALLLTRLTAGTDAAVGSGPAPGVRNGIQAVFGDPLVRRSALSVSLLAGCAMVGESLVAVYAAAELGAGSGMTGLLAAAVPLGTIVASVAVPCRGDHQRLLRLSATVAATGSVIALAGFAVGSSIVAALAAFVGVGVVFAAALPANAVLGLRVQDEVRASAFGLLQGMLMGAQGLGAALGGTLAGWIGVREACLIALMVAAVAGTAAALRPPRVAAELSSNAIDLREVRRGQRELDPAFA